VLPGQVAGTPEEARDIAASLGGTVVIKAQVQAGGRGKAGGVKLATTPDEAYEKARGILALTIKGLPVRKVLVAQAADIAKEYYCAIVMDREKKAPLVMLSSEGGVDIEEVAHTAPDKIVKFHIPLEGLRPYMARNLMAPLFPDFKQAQQAADILMKLYRVYSDGTARSPRSIRSRSRPRARSSRSMPRSCSMTTPTSATRTGRRGAIRPRRRRARGWRARRACRT
jgi:succinyl-CoA synthetase beta subunit